MRALVSSPDGLMEKDVEKPSAGPGRVLIKVKASSLNRADLAMLTGAAHGAAGGMGLPLGLEWAGEVVQVGAGVDKIRTGDRVMAAGPGAFAEYAVTHSEWVYQIPDELSYEQAAALPVALQTMHDAISTNGSLVAGQSVLITGASSAVGIMGMQVAKVLGAGIVIGTSSAPEKRARLPEFGADLAVDTGAPDWTKQVLRATRGKGVDLAIDLLAGPLVNDTLQAIRIGGRMVNVGRMAGNSGVFDFDQHSMRRITYVGVTFRTRTPAEITDVVTRASRELMPALRSGALTMPIDHVCRFDRAADAFERMERNRHFGKIVLALE